MRIVIVAPEQIPVPPIMGGSVEITILAIAKKLAKWHSVTIVSRSHPSYPRHSVLNGVHIYRVPSGGTKTYLGNVKRFLRSYSFDLLQIDNRPKFVGPLKSAFPSAKVSLFLHSLTFVGPTSHAREGLRRADLIIANSASLKSQLMRRFRGVASKIRITWLGVDTSRFVPATGKASGGSVTLLFVGRLIPRKGAPVLLKAAKLAQKRLSRPVKVLLAGGSTQTGYTGRVKSIARGLGVRAEFLGTVPHSQIHKVFQRASLFVCPSQKHESFGLVNVEAMSSGLPVVASANGGIKEIVRHGRTGLLVKQYTKPNAFADAIVRIASNKPLYDKMRREARLEAVRKFSWTATAARLNRIYSGKAAADSR